MSLAKPGQCCSSKGGNIPLPRTCRPGSDELCQPHPVLDHSQKEMEGCGGEGWSAPRSDVRTWGHMGQSSGLSCRCRESSEGGLFPQFPVHPCSGTSNLLPASPGLISHPPARRPFPKLRELLERSYYSAASRRLATPLPSPSSWLPVWNSSEKPAAGGGCLPCPPRSQPAPRTRAGHASPAGNTAHIALYFNPVKGLLGSEQSPAVQS